MILKLSKVEIVAKLVIFGSANIRWSILVTTQFIDC